MLTTPTVPDGSLIFAPFDLSSRKAIIAAVSGGSDSTALLFLLKTHLDRSAPGTRLVAATVDHGLRAGSAAEAADVAALCARHGIEHRILAWTGSKPATGIPAAAREARYRLLAEAADAAGADLILTGHTADDQAETVLMRQSRDQGRGMAGIAPATLFDGRAWIIRPLLDVRRAALRDILRQLGLTWVDDPTNADPTYERPRIRSLLAGDDRRFSGAISTAAQAALRREALGHEAADLVERHATLPAAGLIRLAPDCLAENTDACVYALRILLAVIGGTIHLPDETRTAPLFGRLSAVTPSRAVLSRALVDCRRDGIYLLREARGLPPAQVEDGMIWDGRYRIGATPPGNRVSGHVDPVPASLARAALAAQPVHQGRTFTPILAPWSRFLPAFDLSPARAVAALVGAPEIPVSPFHGHIGREA